MNSHLNKWIYASCCKYFADNLSNQVTFFGEDDVKNTDNLDYWVEFYLDGPRVRQITKNDSLVTWKISIAIIFAQIDTLAYLPQTMEGLVQSLFTSIPIYRYGDSEGEGTVGEGTVGYATLLDCADLEGDVVVHRLGVPGPGMRVLQSFVEGRYRLRTKGDD